MHPIIDQTIAYVKQTLKDAEAGHDWFHVERVWKNAQFILAAEQADVLVVALAALLHDIADSKFHDGDEEIGPQLADQFLRTLAIPAHTIDHVVSIIRHMSYKASLGTVNFSSKEMEIVQDADRLDAIGAIGIARAFHYGGFKNRVLYDPQIQPKPHQDKEAYKSSTAPTINHFYEKLLLLKDKMNTETGRKMAINRHAIMEQFLANFFAEWEGKQ